MQRVKKRKINAGTCGRSNANQWGRYAKKYLNFENFCLSQVILWIQKIVANSGWLDGIA